MLRFKLNVIEKVVVKLYHASCKIIKVIIMLIAHLKISSVFYKSNDIERGEKRERERCILKIY